MGKTLFTGQNVFPFTAGDQSLNKFLDLIVMLSYPAMATVKMTQLENENEAAEFEEQWGKNAVRLRNMLMLLAGYYDQNWFPVLYSYIHNKWI